MNRPSAKLVPSGESENSALRTPHSALASPYLFQGARYDAETGFYYFRNRHYDPRAGRFLQRDPVWDEQNVGGRYTFVGNGPMSRVDPLGLDDRASDSSEPRFKKWSGRPLWPKPKKAAGKSASSQAGRRSLWPVSIEKMRAWRAVQEELSARSRKLSEEIRKLRETEAAESKRMQRLEASLEKKLADLNEAWRQLEFRHQVLPEERRRAKSEECCRRESEIAAEMLEVLRRQRVLEKEMEEWTQWGLQQKMKYQELRRLLSEKTMEAEKGLEWELHRRGVEIWGAKFGTIMSPFKHLEFIPPSFDWREGLIDPALGSDDSVSP